MAETPQNLPDDALLDLLIKQATEGLSPAEQRELDVRDGPAVSTARREIEAAAAAVTLAIAGAAAAPFPPELAQRLADQAAQHFGSRPATSTQPGPAISRAAQPSSLRSSSANRRGGAYGWLAAAACLVFAVFGWLREPTPAPPVAVVVTPPPVKAPALKPVIPPTPAEERQALLAKSGTLQVLLKPTKDPAAAGVTGDVVWDPQTQRGYVHFAGLAANDPAASQYQIWVFDGTRDKRYPVDAGLFDVSAESADIVIPIRAVLQIRKPAAFAVTVEAAGGAVVSNLKHVVALGAAAG